MADQPSHLPAPQAEPAGEPAAVPNLELKAALLLAFTLALVVASALFLLGARGYFEPKQHLVLVTDNAEGVTPGMDLGFQGFPIGRVQRVSLGEDGNVRIEIDVARKDARWLRTTSVFTLIKPIIGATQLRAYTGILTDPPLPDGAERPVLRGDFNEELGRVIGSTKDVLDNLNQMTAQNSELNRTVADLRAFTQKLQGRQGALHAIFGNEEDARRLVATVDRANATLAQLQQLAAHADTRVFGPSGLADDAQASLRQAQALLTDARATLGRMDAVIEQARGVAGNVNSATQDLGSLRDQVEADLRRIDDLINDLNRKWPLAKERKLELP
jgi:phospholipid/cholesterol/gamma-HCH transport system substrate-binding protein